MKLTCSYRFHRPRIVLCHLPHAAIIQCIRPAVEYGLRRM